MKKEDVEKLAEELNVNIEGMNFLQARSVVLKAQKASNGESDEPVSQSSGANTAIVYRNGNFEVRRYTIDMHGEDFEALANEFASQKPEYNVEVLTIERHNVECPHCGRSFTQDKTN